MDGHRPNNTFGGIPTTATDYSPVWDANLYEWTDEAIEKGYRGLLTEEFRILKLARDGYITGPNGAPFGNSSLAPFTAWWVKRLGMFTIEWYSGP